MIKVGIVGCGKIADQHAMAIQEIDDCEIVGVCDKEELMAKQLAHRFKIKHFFSDFKKLLEFTNPDAIHVTTPPQSHYPIAEMALKADCHAFIEKPFALTAAETEELIRLASSKNLTVTVGHDAQFTYSALEMRRLIKDGYLGGPPVHMESYFCYDLSDPAYARVLLGDKTHWVRALPGKLLHNLISHGISKIVEYLRSEEPTVFAHGFTSPLLNDIHETDIIDELRVLIDDKNGTTAYFTFSSQMNPQLHEFRVYGPTNSLLIDYAHLSVIKLRGGKYKSYLDQFLPQYIFAKQYKVNARRNIGRFLKRRFHMDHGMRFLISAFYKSIRESTPPPIPYREIIMTAKIMDEIFSQIYPKTSVETASISR